YGSSSKIRRIDSIRLRSSVASASRPTARRRAAISRSGHRYLGWGSCRLRRAERCLHTSATRRGIVPLVPWLACQGSPRLARAVAVPESIGAAQDLLVAAQQDLLVAAQQDLLVAARIRREEGSTMGRYQRFPPLLTPWLAAPKLVLGWRCRPCCAFCSGRASCEPFQLV